MEAKLWRKGARDLILAAAALFSFCFLAEKLAFLFVPLLAALAFSHAAGRSFRRMRKVRPAVRKTLVILMLLILFALLLLGGILLADKAVRLARDVTEAATQRIPEWAGALSRLLERAEGFLSRLLKREFDGSLSALLPEFAKRAGEKILSLVPEVLGGFFSSVPRALISAVLFLVTTYSLSCRENAAQDLAARFLPEEKARRFAEVESAFFSSLAGFMKAYLKLFLLTFAETAAGLLILRAARPLQGAFFVALVDLLPVFGSGTVLIPWAAISFLGGRTGFGAGLLVLYAVIFAVRQFAEPKILGSSLGLHPVLSLILLVTGLRFFGVGGMLALPLLGACLLPALSKKGEKKERPGPPSEGKTGS